MLKFDMKGYRLQIGVIDDRRRAVRGLAVGKMYGHVASTTKYYHLKPTDVLVTSTLIDTNQLNFSGTSTWTCSIHLDVDDDPKQEQGPLECRVRKIRTADTIVEEVNDLSAGDHRKFKLTVGII
jgi:hypothetical protein